jgi:general secretion pathway protein K
MSHHLHGAPDTEGMVLMTVLWILLVISFISFALAAAVRSELNAAGNSFDSERASYLAKGAAEAVLQKLQNPKDFPESPMQEVSGSYVFHFESGDVRVRPEMDGARIDLNGADEKLLASMFDSMGVDASTRGALVDSILDWRDDDDIPRANGAEVDQYGQPFQGRKRLPANGRFNNVQELLLVKNMTPEIYFGHIAFDPNTNQHQKVAGLRDIATAGSGRNQVDANTAPIEVLSALPNLGADLAASIIAARAQKPFESAKDLFDRVPGLQDSPAHDYVTTDPGFPSVLISNATVQPSGTSKTVRLRLRTERKKRVISFDPFLYIDTPVLEFGGWEY